jgi:hypothetical protein
MVELEPTHAMKRSASEKQFEMIQGLTITFKVWLLFLRLGRTRRQPGRHVFHRGQFRASVACLHIYTVYVATLCPTSRDIGGVCRLQ